VAIGRVGSGSGSGRAGRVSLTFWKKSGRVRVGSGRVNLHVFFRSLIDFDWIEGHLISDRVGSGRVRIGSDQFDFLKKSGRIGFGSGRIGRVFRVGSGSATSSCHRLIKEDKRIDVHILKTCSLELACETRVDVCIS
jgi:hypothetical protein